MKLYLVLKFEHQTEMITLFYIFCLIFQVIIENEYKI